MRYPALIASLLVGAGSLRANPLRTALSTLGVVIGVASLVAVLALGDGAERFARSQIEKTTDLQTIIVNSTTGETIDGVRIPRATYPVFSVADVGSLARALGPTARVSAVVNGSARFVGKDPHAEHAAIVMGVTPAAEERLRPEFAAGHFVTDADVRGAGRVAVVSQRLAETAGVGAGDSLSLEGTKFQVIGVIAQTAKGTPWGMTALVPLTVAEQAMAPSASPRAPQLLVRVARVEDVDSTNAALQRWLAARLGAEWKSQATIGTSSPFRLDQARKSIRVFKMVMGAFAGISLLVGGIGIMNVLLAGVTERTREIGIRKTTGARQRDILLQFLAEAVAVTAVGSVIGVILGLAGAFGVTALIRSRSDMPLYAAFTWATVLVAAMISVVVGLAFGTFPALRAARLTPIDAIRHE